MSKSKLMLVGAVFSFLVTFGCGGGSGSSSGGGSGSVAMSITDAKPVLPETAGKTITNVFVTIDEVLVHKSGGGWISLDLPDNPSPFVIDLMQYSDGFSTELVPPVALEAGKYTQIRLSVVSAKLAFDDDPDPANWVDLTIPSENLKTDENFEFDVGGSAVDITIDFDLSKSIVLEGNGSYKLKPVLHIVDTQAAATIEGKITNSFIDGYAVVTVTDQTIGDVHTTIRVEKTDPNYTVFWLVPNHDYKVEVDYDPGTDKTPPLVDATKTVSASEVGPGVVKIVDFP